MPQLNIADFPPQLVWLAICIVILYIAMAKLAIPRISEVLEGRQDRISRDLDEARRLSEDSEKAKAEYEAALDEARAKAHGMVSELKAELASDQETSKANLEATLATKAKAAEESIAKAKETALSNVRDIAGDAAKAAVSKLISVDVADSDLNSAVDAQMKGEA